MKCKQCGTDLQPQAKYCASCGTRATETGPSKCSSCGDPLREGIKFCPSCGKPVTSPASVSPDSVRPTAAPQQPAPKPTPPPPPRQFAPPPPATKKKSGCLVGCIITGIIGFILGIIIIAFIVVRYGETNVSWSTDKTGASSTESSSPPPPPPPPAQPPQLEKPVQAFTYTTYENSQFGFAADIPSHWESNTKNNSLIFSGKNGTDEFFTTLNFQIISAPRSSLREQANELVDQLKKEKNFKQLEKKSNDLQGYPATLIVVQYQGPGTEEMFTQAQVVIQRKDYFYWMGYTAPSDLAPKYAFVMERAISSFHFTDPQASKAKDEDDIKDQLKDLKDVWEHLIEAINEGKARKR